MGQSMRRVVAPGLLLNGITKDLFVQFVGDGVWLLEQEIGLTWSGQLYIIASRICIHVRIQEALLTVQFTFQFNLIDHLLPVYSNKCLTSISSSCTCSRFCPSFLPYDILFIQSRLSYISSLCK